MEATLIGVHIITAVILHARYEAVHDMCLTVTRGAVSIRSKEGCTAPHYLEYLSSMSPQVRLEPSDTA